MPPHVLVVDDSSLQRTIISGTLGEQFEIVGEAENGREAVELFESTRPDLVTMDIMMPEMDGYEAMQKIREQDRFARLPILALTAKAMKDDRAKCIEAGANDYCSKPIEMGKLTSLMRVWLPR